MLQSVQSFDVPHTAHLGPVCSLFTTSHSVLAKQATVQEEAAANERKFSPSAEAHARESCMRNLIYEYMN
jgi:hypothetical protein